MNIIGLEKLVLAIPKGRIGRTLESWFCPLGIIPEDTFFDYSSRQLLFSTNRNDLSLIRVRSFDVIKHVAFGSASMGVVGSDVIAEFNFPEILAPVDLRFGICRLSLAELRKKNVTEQLNSLNDSLNTARVATKYPNLTKAYFLKHGMQCEALKLNGSIELAPKLGICPRIVDLVSTGATLKANDLLETEILMTVSAHLVVNRVLVKTASKKHQYWIEKFREISDVISIQTRS